MKRFVSVLFSKKIVVASVKISLVVGTLLNLVNQGEAIVGEDYISWSHVFFNYLLPYCVASYSAVKNELLKD
jgi:hypothetical protein